MNDIQKARDVLDKRRAASRKSGPQERFWFTADVDPAVKNLFMLTTDHDLLDAIDLFLADPVDLDAAERIAAAIIAADDRMQQ